MFVFGSVKQEIKRREHFNLPLEFHRWSEAADRENCDLFTVGRELILFTNPLYEINRFYKPRYCLHKVSIRKIIAIEME